MKRFIFLFIVVFYYACLRGAHTPFVINVSKELNIYFPELILQDGSKYYPRFDCFSEDGYTREEWLQARKRYTHERKAEKNVYTLLGLVTFELSTQEEKNPSFKELKQELERLIEIYTCSVCLEPMEWAVKTKRCKKPHLFHKTCFKKVQEEKQACPLCRTITAAETEESLTALGIFTKVDLNPQP